MSIARFVTLTLGETSDRSSEACIKLPGGLPLARTAVILLKGQVDDRELLWLTFFSGISPPPFFLSSCWQLKLRGRSRLPSSDGAS